MQAKGKKKTTTKTNQKQNQYPTEELVKLQETEVSTGAAMLGSCVLPIRGRWLFPLLEGGSPAGLGHGDLQGHLLLPRTHSGRFGFFHLTHSLSILSTHEMQMRRGWRTLPRVGCTAWHPLPCYQPYGDSGGHGGMLGELRKLS